MKLSESILKEIGTTKNKEYNDVLRTNFDAANEILEGSKILNEHLNVLMKVMPSKEVEEKVEGFLEDLKVINTIASKIVDFTYSEAKKNRK